MNWDNMDGKQARKTGSSSPLGMLYDHGLDTMTGWIIGLNLAALTQMGNSVGSYWSIIMIAILPLYIAFWEEHQLGKIVFSAINGVDEGLFVIIGWQLWSGFVGPEWFTSPSFLKGWQWNQICAVFGVACGIFTMLESFKKVFEGYNKVHPGKSVWKTLPMLNIVWLTAICMYIVAEYSPDNVAEKYTRWCIYYFGMTWVREVARLLVANCVEQPFNQWSKQMIFADVAIAANVLIGHFTGQCPINEYYFLVVGTILSIWSYFHYAACITNQITGLLGINVWTIKRKVK